MRTMVSAYPLICSLDYGLDAREQLAIAFTILLALEVAVLAWQRSRHRATITPRTLWSSSLAVLALAFLACLVLTVWLIAQRALFLTDFATATLCGGHYDPQFVVPAFGPLVNASALESATFGAILAVFGLGTLFALLSFLRESRRLSAPVASGR